MKKLILLTLFFVIGSSLTPQTNPDNTDKTQTKEDNRKLSYEEQVSSYLNEINSDTERLKNEKEEVDKALKLNKLLRAEQKTRFNRILKKIEAKKNRPKDINSPELEINSKKQIVKQRYILEKDSICNKKALFSTRCIKWDIYYVLTDNKTNESLILQQK